MSSQKARQSKHNTLPLDLNFTRENDTAIIERQLRGIVRSVKFEFLEKQSAFCILGPEMSYHAIDPFLPEVLNQYGTKIGVSNILSYRSRSGLFDLCFEDTWSGYFVADRLSTACKSDDLVFIHLDDHTDMMSTLLVRSGEKLCDPATGNSFDPAKTENWESAIYSGSVGIGNFITPLYYLDRQVHVRHLNNVLTSSYELHSVTRSSCTYDEIPDIQFAAIRKSSSEWQNSAGTCLGGSSAELILQDLPVGRLVVHIDLDYFINDFNGNPRTGSYIPDPELRTIAKLKMDRFFDALEAVSLKIDHWIIATSPGFCSAYHWDWLLRQIEQRIKQL